jgi:DNA mismatch repair protein MSH6
MSKLKSPFLAEDEASLVGSSRDGSDERFPWLVKLCDAGGRTPEDPDYDPRTLYIPKSAWQKFTPFEKQFWEIKANLFDTVVFFKKGKFYELYENDADVGAREFDLKMTDRVNMRMVGVPEMAFEMWAARFVAAGYKIARVDQTETAIGKSIREKESDSKAEKIIRRELSCILTAGTVTEPSMIASDSASYCMAIKEKVMAGEIVNVGVAIVDAATGTFHLCDFEDDISRSILETLLMQLQPKEVILEKGRTSSETRRTIKNLLPSALITEAHPDSEFKSRSRTADELDMGQYFSDGSWPTVLRDHYEGELQSFLAFGALLWYLCELKLDRGLLSYKNVLVLDPVKSASSLVLDGQTLLNLDILPSSLRSSVSAVDARKGTLLSVVDHCVTPFGKRLIYSWICHPLRNSVAINARLDTVEYFLAEPGLVSQLSEKLYRLPDLERSLSRIHSGSAKLKDFLATIDGFKVIIDIIGIFQDMPDIPSAVSECLAEVPDYSAVIEYFLTAFDRQAALKEGQIIPSVGVEEKYDSAQAQFAKVQSDLQAYLYEQEKVLKIRGAKYRDIGKEIFQLELSADVVVPKEYILMSKTKTAKRYWTSRIKELVKSYQEWEERRSAILRGVYGNLLAQFDENVGNWRAAVSAMAKLDCLLSLAKASMLMSEPKCRPVIVDSTEAFCDLKEVRHACITETTSFIPNDIALGVKDDGRMILLTGPNMGGKSTLLRQVHVGLTCFI